MKEIRWVKVNDQEVPVLISDEKEALLAAKAAGRAVVGLWRPGQEMDALAGARYVVEAAEDVTDEFAERMARRNMGLPWRICETERLVIREIFADDFDEIWLHQIGQGFGSVEGLAAYTKNQYEFYEFGFWALLEKKSGELIGVAGLTVPEEVTDPQTEIYVLEFSESGQQENADTLELGYHIFPAYRRNGYAKESCRAILQYGHEVLGTERFLARIDKENHVSMRTAQALGFVRRDDMLT